MSTLAESRIIREYLVGSAPSLRWGTKDRIPKSRAKADSIWSCYQILMFCQILCVPGEIITSGYNDPLGTMKMLNNLHRVVAPEINPEWLGWIMNLQNFIATWEQSYSSVWFVPAGDRWPIFIASVMISGHNCFVNVSVSTPLRLSAHFWEALVGNSVRKPISSI